MLNTQELQGHWTELKGKAREKWGQLTADDLQIVGGNVDQMIGRIQQRTGEQKQVIENFFNDLIDDGSKLGSAMQSAKQTAVEYAEEATKTVEDGFNSARDMAHKGYEQARDQVREGYDRAEELVKQRPAEAVVTLFGLGLLAGVVLGLCLRSSD